MMELKILWMYHDLMDLYGDKGNAEVLRVRAQKRGIDVTLDTCTIGEKKDISDYDLFFMGGGADHEQGLIHEDLLSRRDNIQKAMDEKTAFLLICGAYQLFGQYYRDQDPQTAITAALATLPLKQPLMEKHSRLSVLKTMVVRQRVSQHHLEEC